jgi:hypothetical protein
VSGGLPFILCPDGAYVYWCLKKSVFGVWIQSDTELFRLVRFGSSRIRELVGLVRSIRIRIPNVVPHQASVATVVMWWQFSQFCTKTKKNIVTAPCT